MKLVLKSLITVYVNLNGSNIGGTLRSRQRIGVDFEQIYVFCDKCCVCIDKCVFIIVKIKRVNFGKISDICDKVNFITNYTHYTTPDNILSKHIQILPFLTPLERQSHSGT